MPDTGPHITAALLCEKVITEADGVLSFMRVVDRITNTVSGLDPPDEMPPMLANIQMVVALKADRAKGRSRIKFSMEAPDGTTAELGEQDVSFTPGNAGANLVIGLQLGLQHEGVYWINIILGGPRGQEDVLLTRTPLEIVYQRQRVAVPHPPNHLDE